MLRYTQKGKQKPKQATALYLVLNTKVLHQTDEEGGGPAMGAIQQQSLGTTLLCGLQTARDDGSVHCLFCHGAVRGPLATW